MRSIHQQPMALFDHLPKRKRQTLLTAALSGGFVAASSLALIVATQSQTAYTPGEQSEGITSTLARELPPGYTGVQFSNVAAEAGIDFVHFEGTRSSQLPEDMGSGAAWGDYDGDGWPDLFIANVVGPLTITQEEISGSPAYCRFYRNNQDGTFSDVTLEAGVDYRGWANGAAWGDVENDGDLDLVVSAYGELVLFRNNGDGTFENATESLGLDGYSGFWTGVSWGDYDRDGFADLYVTGYVRYERPEHGARTLQYDVENPASINPSSFSPERNLLFHNREGVGFEEVGLKSGVSNPEGRSLSAAWFDADEDGWLDLYVANDVSDNVLYRNMGDGTFRDISHQAHVADYRGAMGIAVADWDGDTDQDVVVSHWVAQENALYTNLLAQDRAQGRVPFPRFIDEADRVGLGQISLDFVGWATSFFDFDNDGRLDLFVANGSTLQDRDDESRLVPMSSQIFWNAGPEEGFFDVSSVSGEFFTRPFVSRGAAVADYDRDGDLDVVIVNHGERAVLLRNDSDGRSNWIAVTLEGRASNRQGLGAMIRVVAGDLVQVRQVGSQASYLSQNELNEHFGLGARSVVDSIIVTWPSGAYQVATDVAVRERIRLVEPNPSL